MKIEIRRSQIIIGPAMVFLLMVACGGADATSAPAFSPEVPATTPTPRVPAATATGTPISIADGTDTAGGRFIQLEDPLDEPEYYCVDVPGAGPGVRLQAALQAHTCKPVAVAEDGLFMVNHPSDGQIYMKAYDLCVAADGPESESLLHLEPCSDAPLQSFSFASDGRIQLEGGSVAGLCLAVAPGPGTPTGGPSHLRLGLNLQRCNDVGPLRSTWITR